MRWQGGSAEPAAGNSNRADSIVSLPTRPRSCQKAATLDDGHRSSRRVARADAPLTDGTVNALLVRVGADRGRLGGKWNGLVDTDSWKFAYVPIPESGSVHAGLEKPYPALNPVLARFGATLPAHLQVRHMHLDPDFEHLTYGDVGGRASQLRASLGVGDWIVFYAGLYSATRADLVYAIIGVFMVHSFVLARDIPRTDRDINAHSRRVLKPGAQDLVIRGRPGVSGRLERCLPFGEYRDRAYRVRRDLLEEWGGLSVKDGYVQRSARLPRFLDPDRFLRWLGKQGPVLKPHNN